MRPLPLVYPGEQIQVFADDRWLHNEVQMKLMHAHLIEDHSI